MGDFFQMIWEVLTTWYILALLVALIALIGVLLYLRNKTDED